MKHRRFLAGALVLLMIWLVLTGAAVAEGPGPTDVGQAADAASPPATDPTPSGPLPAPPDPPAGATDLPANASATTSPLWGGFGPLSASVQSGPSGGCPGVLPTHSGSITAAELVQTGRLVRNGAVSTCDQVKTAPALFDTLLHHYRAFSFRNSAAYDQCYTVNVTSSCPGNVGGAFFTTYLDGFASSSPQANYLADEGASGLTNYSFVVPSGRDFYVVANEVNADQGCASFQFTLARCVNWRTTINDSITRADAGQTNRLRRDGLPSTCAAIKAYPGVYSAAKIHYRTYDFTNATSKPACYTVTASAPACVDPANVIFVAAYLGPYDPSNIATNYLADSGSSPYPVQPFAFNIAAGQAFKLVVTSVANDDGAGTNGTCSAYSLDVTRYGKEVCLPLLVR